MTPVTRRFTFALASCALLIAAHALLVSSSAFTDIGGGGKVIAVAAAKTTTTAATAATATSTAGSESACATMQRWATKYEGGSLSLNELAAFDRPHRRAAFAVLAPESRAALMQTQLREFRLRGDLTAEQRALIDEGIAIATPTLYRRDPAAREALLEFWGRAKGSFTSREHLRAWGDIGGMRHASRVSAMSLWERVTSPYLALAQEPICECNHGSPGLDCGGGTCPGSISCTPQVNGCGVFNLFACNGMCQ